jgi:dienelactone hydrolase
MTRIVALRAVLAVEIMLGTLGGALAADATSARSGVVEFEPCPNEKELPARFQLEPHTFTFEQKQLPTSSSTMRLSKVTFPSPVVTADVNNNTVHCEFFCPTKPGPKPAVVVLHILGGDFDLSRLFARALASRGVSALFLIMPYYGPRQQPGSPARMISADPRATVQGMTQAVLDIRQAAAWLGAQDDVDREAMGVMGISLGGITAALAAGIEPRFQKACLILAGGDIGQVVWESAEMAAVRKSWTASGGTRESLCELLKVVDPVTYASKIKGREVLMLNASRDEVVPRACTEALWRSLGQPTIVWWNAGHYSAARYMFDGVAKTVEFFEAR